MAKVYADLIRKGLKTIEQVPEAKREEVRQKLIEMGYPEITNHEYSEKEKMV